MPGYLLPQDLEPMREALGCSTLEQLAERYLMASPGAVVQSGAQRFRIPTLVPRRGEDDMCVFFTEDERCDIHPVAPFGCAYADSHMSREDGDRRSMWGLQLLMRHPRQYYKLWFDLAEREQYAIGPEIARVKLAEQAISK
jgi:hypothetical protein